MLRHTISGTICCFDIQRNSGPIFNSNRKTSLQRGTLITVSKKKESEEWGLSCVFQLRRSVSGSLYADKSEIEKSHCNTLFNRGVVLTLTRVLGLWSTHSNNSIYLSERGEMRRNMKYINLSWNIYDITFWPAICEISIILRSGVICLSIWPPL